MRAGYTDLTITVADELVPSLIEGVECRGFKIEPNDDGGWRLVVQADLSTVPEPLRDEALKTFLGL